MCELGPNELQVSTIGVLALQVRTLKEKLDKGQISVIDQQLGRIFTQLKRLVTEDQILPALNVMQDGTTILGEKIEEIFRFILQLSHREQINRLLNEHLSDDHLAALLQQFWYQPCMPPQGSHSFLEESWVQLVKNKPERNDGATPPEDQFLGAEPEQRPIESYQEPFEARMIQYFTSIEPSLPCRYAALMPKEIQSETDTEHFILFLHLMQNGKIHYNKDLDLIEKGDVTDE